MPCLYNRLKEDSTMEQAEKAKEKLQADFQALLRDARVLLDASSEAADEKTKEARERLSKTVEEARLKWSEAENRLGEKAEKVDKFVRDKPYQAVGIGVLAGLFFGWLFSRK